MCIYCVFVQFIAYTEKQLYTTYATFAGNKTHENIIRAHPAPTIHYTALVSRKNLSQLEGHCFGNQEYQITLLPSQLCTWKASALQIQPHIAHLYSILKKTLVCSASASRSLRAATWPAPGCVRLAPGTRPGHMKNTPERRSERMPNAPRVTMYGASAGLLPVRPAPPTPKKTLRICANPMTHPGRGRVGTCRPVATLLHQSFLFVLVVRLQLFYIKRKQCYFMRF